MGSEISPPKIKAFNRELSGKDQKVSEPISGSFTDYQSLGTIGLVEKPTSLKINTLQSLWELASGTLINQVIGKLEPILINYLILKV